MTNPLVVPTYARNEFESSAQYAGAVGEARNGASA